MPLSERGIPAPFTPAGLPLCAAGFPMPVKNTYMDQTSLVPHQRARYACPLCFPQPSAQLAPSTTSILPTAAVSTPPPPVSAHACAFNSTATAPYQAIYHQRTADERINGQAKELGIERPMLRRGSAIANQNTLIYVLINLRSLQRVRTHQEALARQTPAR